MSACTALLHHAYAFYKMRPLVSATPYLDEIYVVVTSATVEKHGKVRSEKRICIEQNIAFTK